MKRVAVITSSDKGYRGEREDLTGADAGRDFGGNEVSGDFTEDQLCASWDPGAGSLPCGAFCQGSQGACAVY